MQFPKPDYFSLTEAAEYIAKQCREPLDKAWPVLVRALQEGALVAFGRRTHGYNDAISSQSWREAVIRDNGAKVLFHVADGCYSDYERIEISRSSIDLWLEIGRDEAGHAADQNTGRATRKQDIITAFQQLCDEDVIDPHGLQKQIYEPVRQRVMENLRTKSQNGLRDKTLHRHLSEIFAEYSKVSGQSQI